jgi:inosine-uridine nucleoside N-ribohydrolase
VLHVTTPKIILDCDPGHDDAMAILLAAHHADLLGITTVSGNAPLAATTRNALLVTQIADIDVEVHAGAGRPLLVEAKHAAHAHGQTGLDGPDLPELERSVTSHDAVGFIIETVRSNDDVWLVPVGPMTNIAIALRQAPDIIEKMAGISFMGGSMGPGNATPTAEFNFWADPHAARIMIGAGVPTVKMAGLNLTSQYTFGEELSERLVGLGTSTGVFAGQVIGSYIAAARRNQAWSVAHLHDPCAVLAITHPDLFETAQMHVDVSTGSVTEGMSVVDQRGYGSQEPNVEVLTSINRQKAVEVLIEAVATYR